MSQTTTFRLGPDTELALRRHTDELLEVAAEWAPTDSPPLLHLHPEQDERFELLEGEMSVVAGDDRRTLRAGDVYEVPRGTPHQMWNSGATPARAIWQTRPSGRTVEFYAFIDGITREPPGPEDGAAAGEKLASFADVFRLA